MNDIKKNTDSLSTSEISDSDFKYKYRVAVNKLLDTTSKSTNGYRMEFLQGYLDYSDITIDIYNKLVSVSIGKDDINVVNKTLVSDIYNIMTNIYPYIEYIGIKKYFNNIDGFIIPDKIVEIADRTHLYIQMFGYPFCSYTDEFQGNKILVYKSSVGRIKSDQNYYFSGDSKISILLAPSGDEVYKAVCILLKGTLDNIKDYIIPQLEMTSIMNSLVTD